MSRIVLISCASKKQEHRCTAKDMYISPLFKMSLQYAKSIQPEKIYILSAKYHLLELDDIIEPYNVTLCNVPVNKRKPDLKILTKNERYEWGNIVIETLNQKTNKRNDEFIILAGNRYIEPLQGWLNTCNLRNILQGKRQGERLKYLKEHTK